MASLFWWLCLSVLVSSASTDGVTRPSIVEPVSGPPQDKFNCRISTASVLPWLVAVWDVGEKLIVGHGSMLTYIAFITTCSQYPKASSQYEAHAQFLWNVDDPSDPCTQSKVIDTISKHPNCQGSTEWSPYDFAVFKMKNPFDIYGKTYPTVRVSNNENELLNGVKFINTYDVTNTRGCFMPAFKSQEDKIPVFNFRSPFIMQVIPFKDKCKKLLCEKQPADVNFSTACEEHYKEDLDTYLCMKNKSNSAIQLGKDNSYWLAGAPLYCNGTVYGIAVKPKIRKDFSADTTDFHFIAPFFRVWPWIVEHITANSAPWVVDVYIDSKMRFVVHENDRPHTNLTNAVRPSLLVIGILVYLVSSLVLFLEQSILKNNINKQ